MGTNLIVLDSAEAVMELMEKRSSRYSDRCVGFGVLVKRDPVHDRR